MDRVECVVVGAGVIGLAVARRLARAGREVLVLEAAAAIGTGISARNSEVIHAGIYYPPGTIRARLCVAGKRALYEFCQSHGVPHRRATKLIVATEPAQQARLEALERQARANGVTDLIALEGAALRALEPALRCGAALLSPSTGILDSHAYMLALLGEAQDHGAMVALRSPVMAGACCSQGFRLTVGGSEPTQLACRVLINCAGLEAQALSAGLAGLPAATVPRRVLAKGNYFSLSGAKAPVQRLIYPIPEEGGLGVHITLDLAGQVRFGPDVEWIDQISYTVDPGRAERFYAAVRRYWPALPDRALVPAYAGIRPKLTGPGQPAADFVIQDQTDHGIPGLITLYGIESPGLTASLAIADEVVARL